MKKPKNKLVGERIELNLLKPTLKLAEEIFAVVEDNHKHLAPWLSWEKETKKVEDTFKYLLSMHEDNKNGTNYTYGIYIDNEYIGNVGIFDYDKKKQSTEIGFWLSRRYIKKGYMTEAVKILEKELFNTLDLNRIQIRCDDKNKGSEGVIKKCGYKLEGKSREDTVCDYTKTFRSTLVFSKLKRELK